MSDVSFMMHVLFQFFVFPLVTTSKRDARMKFDNIQSKYRIKQGDYNDKPVGWGTDAVFPLPGVPEPAGLCVMVFYGS